MPEGSFWIREHRSLAGAGLAHSITTQTSIRNRGLHVADLDPVAEAFLVISKGEPRYRRVRFRFQLDTEVSEELAGRMLAEQAKRWLEAELDDHLHSWRKKEEPSGPYPPPYETSEITDTDVARLRLLDAFSEETLNTIEQETACNTLSGYIQKALFLSKLISRELQEKPAALAAAGRG